METILEALAFVAGFWVVAHAHNETLSQAVHDLLTKLRGQGTAAGGCACGGSCGDCSSLALAPQAPIRVSSINPGDPVTGPPESIVPVSLLNSILLPGTSGSSGGTGGSYKPQNGVRVSRF